MDHIVSALADVGGQLTANPQHVVAAADHGGNAHVPGLLGKGALPEAHQLGMDVLIQMLQQTQHMGLGAAGVAAADEVNDFHEMPFFRLGLVKQQKILYNTSWSLSRRQSVKFRRGAPFSEDTMEQKAKRIGKFNIIDIIAVILILAVVAFAGWKLLNRAGAADLGEDSQVKVTYVVKCEGVPAELYETCQAHLPSPLMASGALVGGQVESVEKEPYYVLGPDGQWVEDPDHVTLLFTATTETAAGEVMTTKVGDQEVRIGKTDYILKSEYIEFSGGTIVDVQWDEPEPAQ